jgi:protein disulfide-isomerase A6
MKAFFYTACAVLAIALANAAGDPTASLPGVVDLTPDNFNSIVNGNKHALVEFYAPWCGHCKHLVPEYTKLGQMVMNDPKLRSKVVVAKVDADAHRSLGQTFGVTGFPTIKFFARGQAATKDNAEDYNSARSADAFLKFLMDKVAADTDLARVEALDPVASKFLTADDKEAVVAEGRALLAGLSGEEKENGELYVRFMEKAITKGVEYFAKEKARLDKMLSTGNVNADKADEMSRKVSVLGAFTEDDE